MSSHAGSSVLKLTAVLLLAGAVALARFSDEVVPNVGFERGCFLRIDAGSDTGTIDGATQRRSDDAERGGS